MVIDCARGFACLRFGFLLLGSLVVSGLSGAAAEDVGGEGGTALRIEAEEASVRTVGVELDGVWNQHSNGSVGEYIRVGEEGVYRITVRAYGSPASGEWPRMGLQIDGATRGSNLVATETPRDYVFEARLSAGAHLIQIAFSNDAYAPPEDRNLYIDRMDIESTGDAPTPQRTTEEEYMERYEPLEKAILAQTVESVQGNRMGPATLRVVDAGGTPVAGAQVSIDHFRHDFLFGSNIYMFDRFKTDAENAAYKKRFEELFNYATAGFYWAGFEREKGKPNYEYMDRVVGWCRERGIRVKGHPLLWDHEAGVPPWSDGQPSAEVQKKRVEEIVRRYEGKIEFWEVVNEAAHLGGVRIDEPYRWARAASPGGYLIVNDYYVMADGFPPFLELLKEAQKNGVPFEGIGIQAHEPDHMAFPLERVQGVLDTYAELGKELHITEFTPASDGEAVTGSPWRGVWDEAQQAQYAEDFYRVCFADPRVVGITWWDLCDNGAWRPHGGMLHADLTPKPVYEALMKLIHEEWSTNVDAKSDGSGRVEFTGFHGQYKVRVERDGSVVEKEFHLAKGEENDWTLEIE